ncbi:fibronectin type III-like domain-contianing protein [Streptomyces panaciradicis]|uniref:fibronectin type III-like domain-contianing protein n=1 Tax=Streptomyces panaciradicis TaxID=1470261 RepID=UPI00201CBD7F|nr:fibronectin type III-like domain-contianing protein [Streptomyces panaciradicis]MCL6672394.1 fibronectin type III-like domain-contianing protein [Streptomyces panaciradicis]
MSHTVSRRSAPRPPGGPIAVTAAATGDLPPAAHARTRPEAGAGPRAEGLVLRAGERCRVRVQVAPRALSSWDPKRHDRVLGTGHRPVRVGASVRDLRLHTGVEVGT